ncbi:hypothetical protein OFC53_32785, partial [Escherichia coli]|nr:hypothetical protein [Escherichia coli]
KNKQNYDKYQRNNRCGKGKAGIACPMSKQSKPGKEHTAGNRDDAYNRGFDVFEAKKPGDL